MFTMLSRPCNEDPLDPQLCMVNQGCTLFCCKHSLWIHVLVRNFEIYHLGKIDKDITILSEIVSWMV